MARPGRKQLAVLIKEESFSKFEQIKEDLGLSNAKIIEMLIENYTNTSTNTQKSTNINTNINTTEEILRKILKEELACINTNTNTNTHKKESTNINTNTNTEPIITIIKSKKETVPTWNGIKLKPNDRVITDEYGIETLVTDEIPEWQKKPLTTQDFYGKVPEPYTPGEYDHDPQRYLDEMDEKEGRSKPKPKKVEEEKPFNPFL
jgi:hypothetical protein